jgi:hypothetical protein
MAWTGVGPVNPLWSRAEGRRGSSLPVLHTQNSRGNLRERLEECKGYFRAFWASIILIILLLIIILIAIVNGAGIQSQAED